MQEAGFEPVVAGPEARIFQMVLHEIRPGWTITREWEGYQLKADIAFRDIDPAEYAASSSPAAGRPNISATIPT